MKWKYKIKKEWYHEYRWCVFTKNAQTEVRSKLHWANVPESVYESIQLATSTFWIQWKRNDSRLSYSASPALHQNSWLSRNAWPGSRQDSCLSQCYGCQTSKILGSVAVLFLPSVRLSSHCITTDSFRSVELKIHYCLAPFWSIDLESVPFLQRPP